nr:serine hydrolase [Paracoccus mutanolyticus]
MYSQNADTRLHPASLTKMMTLYMAFTAIERGQVRLDSKFLVSQHAASQPPSRLGLKPGQRIELRYLIRAAAVKSANDAATTIGEGLAGSEPKFAAQMTAMARALGMRNTNFRNANGLTVEGHYSSARDMSLLGRRLFYDFPQYYSIFSRRTADAGIATVSSTNKRFLDSYEGADGIKTGYTRAAGFNLTASAKRGSKRIIATVLGGNSTAHRNAVMAQLLDAGFGKAPTRVREVKPAAPALVAERGQGAPGQVAPVPARSPPSCRCDAPAQACGARLVRGAGHRRPSRSRQPAQADAGASASGRPARKPAAVASASTKGSDDLGISSARPTGRPEGDSGSDAGTIAAKRPVPAPRRDESASLAPAADVPSLFLLDQVAPAAPQMALAETPPPAPRGDAIILASLAPETAEEPAPQIVSRSTGGRGYGVSLGLYRSRHEAEQLLLRTALQDSAALGNAVSRVADTRRGFQANFEGMSRQMAELTCDRLAARQQDCTVIGQ